jgi:hypothetical protein
MRHRLVLGSEGVLQLPLALVLFTLTSTVFGMSAIAQLWTRKVQIQLELDSCLGRRAILLKKSLNSIESGNGKIQALRIATAGSIATGQLELAETTRRAIQVVARLQELEKLRWNAEQVRWWTDRECRGLKAPLPVLPHKRKPPDLLGENVLEWQNPQPKPFQLTVFRSGREARAFVFEEPDHHGKWQASWKEPAKNQIAKR